MNYISSDITVDATAFASAVARSPLAGPDADRLEVERRVDEDELRAQVRGELEGRLTGDLRGVAGAHLVAADRDPPVDDIEIAAPSGADIAFAGASGYDQIGPMNPFFAAMLACAGLAILLIAVGPSLLPDGTRRSLARLLIGLMAGFVTIPLPMLMLPALAIGIVLVLNDLREGRLRDAGLVLIGAGSVWTVLFSWLAWDTGIDGRVMSTSVGFLLAIGLGMLVAGISVIAGDAAVRRRGA
jgi:hypothetical protein